MQQLIVMAIGGLLSVSLITTVNAAPTTKTDQPKTSQGIINARKAMQGKLERDKKIQEVRNKGKSLKHQTR